jgi:MFS family permease
LASLAVSAVIRFAPSAFTEEQMTQLRDQKGIIGIFDRSALPLSLMVVPLSMCYASVTAFLEAYTKQLGILWAASAFFTIYGLFMIVSRPIAGRIADRRGENPVMVTTILVNTAGIVALGLAGVLFGAVAPALVIAAAFMFAAGFGSVLPLGVAVAVKHAEPYCFSRITATYWVFSDCGMGVGALVFGLVASRAGFAGMFFFEIPIALGALVIYWTLHGRYHRPGAGPSG